MCERCQTGDRNGRRPEAEVTAVDLTCAAPPVAEQSSHGTAVAATDVKRLRPISRRVRRTTEVSTETCSTHPKSISSVIRVPSFARNSRIRSSALLASSLLAVALEQKCPLPASRLLRGTRRESECATGLARAPSCGRGSPNADRPLSQHRGRAHLSAASSGSRSPCTSTITATHFHAGELHQAELLDNWQRARVGGTLNEIDPLQ
jgi:hypothetical protein